MLEIQHHWSLAKSSLGAKERWLSWGKRKAKQANPCLPPKLTPSHVQPCGASHLSTQHRAGCCRGAGLDNQSNCKGRVKAVEMLTSPRKPPCNDCLCPGRPACQKEHPCQTSHLQTTMSAPPEPPNLATGSPKAASHKSNPARRRELARAIAAPPARCLLPGLGGCGHRASLFGDTLVSPPGPVLSLPPSPPSYAFHASVSEGPARRHVPKFPGF